MEVTGEDGAHCRFRRRCGALLADLLPLDTAPDVETIRRRTLQVGARLERAALVPPDECSSAPATAITLAIDAGHVKSIKTYQVRSFEVMLARVGNDQGREVVFSSLPAEADLDAALEAADDPPARKVAALLRALETYIVGQADLIIDDAAARHRSEAISTATTESTVQRLLHRSMGANQQMRWSPRGAHRMRTVRTAVMNGTLAAEPARASAATTPRPSHTPADHFAGRRNAPQV